MAFSIRDTAQLIAALTVLLIAAHGMGRLLVALKQPRVVGEILGGILIGPTVLPGSVRAVILPQTGPTAAALGAIFQLGLLLVMFSIGLEMRSRRGPRDGATITWVVGLGMALPLLGGLVFFRAWDVSTMIGPANSPLALGIVVACAIAVTSTPVIGRILGDLDLLGTRFARIVLGSAVIEDGVLFVLLSFAFRLVADDRNEGFGVASWIGIPSWGLHVWHVAVPVTMLALLMTRERTSMVRSLTGGVLQQESTLSVLIVLMLAVTGSAMLFGVSPMLGALAAGALCGSTGGVEEEEHAPVRQAKDTFRSFANAFFGPLYFGGVGLRLDLVRDFDPKMCLVILAYASGVKLFSVYLAARFAGEPRRWSWDLAIAMNARGAPGIVLATAAHDAGVINAPFQLTLVLLALTTSSAAGSWLKRVGSRLTDR